MTWQTRLPGVWVFGEEVRGVVRDSIAEVAAVPAKFGGAEWAWAIIPHAGELCAPDPDDGPFKGTEKRFGDAVNQAEAALRRTGVKL